MAFDPPQQWPIYNIFPSTLNNLYSNSIQILPSTFLATIHSIFSTYFPVIKRGNQRIIIALWDQ